MPRERKINTGTLPAEEQYLKAAEIELVYKSKVSAAKRPTVNSANDAYRILRHAWNENTIELREEFKIMFLNNANKVLGIYHAFTGHGTSVVVDIRLIFAAAMKANAISIVIAHNHPSGNLKPSKGDIALTNRIRFAADMMDIKVLDHLIVNKEGFYSMADSGLMRKG